MDPMRLPLLLQFQESELLKLLKEKRSAKENVKILSVWKRDYYIENIKCFSFYMSKHIYSFCL